MAKGVLVLISKRMKKSYENRGICLFFGSTCPDKAASIFVCKQIFKGLTDAGMMLLSLSGKFPTSLIFP